MWHSRILDMRFIFTLLIALFLASCSDNYEQYYTDYLSFKKSSARQQGWFPEILGPDCFDFKEIHNLGNNNSYGTFAFVDEKRINSILADTKKYKQIKKLEVDSILNKIVSPKRPKWFIKDISLNYFDFYIQDLNCIIKDGRNKRIYFLYTSL
ncbi:hypothetical protein DHW03_16915 [Pedobacter yonginense]|uniref:YbbD head domain-containing protein n=1 Tax=Pedobacter yonginense TaxID=651869 RepID=A0A317EK52_9SPHI|nr:hypothetical protein DHW03_16915 [Pedobacter yonginense]